MQCSKRRRRHIPSLILVLVLSVAALPALAASGVDDPLDDSGDAFLKRWTAVMMTGGTTYTEAEARDIARHSDLVVAGAATFRDHIDAMRAENPDLTVFGYLNGAFAQENEGSAYPEAWYARDAEGNKITSSGWGNYLMDLNATGWRDNVATRCENWLARNGYDGCYLDMLGVAPLFPGYLSSEPVNSSTGTSWTAEQWMNATSAVAARASDHNDGKLVTGNGLGSGGRYFRASGGTDVLVDATHGAVPEAFLRSGSWGVTKYRSESAWKQDVDMITDVESRGGAALAMTKINRSATQAQKDAWREYALASFYLGTNGGSFFTFHESKSASAITMDHPWERVSIGTPVESYAKRGGAYQRTFTDGLVLVNPTSSAVTVPLSGSYIDLRGISVSGAIALPANSGRVLRTSGTTTEPTTGPTTGNGASAPPWRGRPPTSCCGSCAPPRAGSPRRWTPTATAPRARSTSGPRTSCATCSARRTAPGPRRSSTSPPRAPSSTAVPHCSCATPRRTPHGWPTSGRDSSRPAPTGPDPHATTRWWRPGTA